MQIILYMYEPLQHLRLFMQWTYMYRVYEILFGLFHYFYEDN